MRRLYLHWRGAGLRAVLGEFSSRKRELTENSDKGCTKSDATLTTDGNGNTNTVELRAGTYYVKETKAPKGFQLDKTVHTLTVKAGEDYYLKGQ